MANEPKTAPAITLTTWLFMGILNVSVLLVPVCRFKPLRPLDQSRLPTERRKKSGGRRGVEENENGSALTGFDSFQREGFSLAFTSLDAVVWHPSVK